MKKWVFSIGVLVVVFCMLVIVGCLPQRITYDVYAPVYLSYEQIRGGIEFSPTARTLEETGKIYLYQTTVFVNEFKQGVHVIDNTDPTNPQKQGFIEIPGNVDIAIRNNILYADSYTDLVAIDISDPENPVEVSRIEDIFPYNVPWDLYPTDREYWDRFEPYDEAEGIVIGWEKVRTETEWISVDHYDMEFSVQADTGSAGGTNTTGTGGSMARFTIVDTYLYALTGGDMQLFDIASPEDPVVFSRVSIDWDIETIFPYKDKLFIGSMTGMFVFDNSNPENPQKIIEFTHATSCDPVVATDDYAYVTLRAGNMCGGGSNQLDIIDISGIDMDPPDITLVETYAMQEPYGLGVDNTSVTGTVLLFICDGSVGLKLYDATDPLNLTLLSHESDMETFDVIPVPSRQEAIVVGPDGLHQFSYVNQQTQAIELQEISVITIERP